MGNFISNDEQENVQNNRQMYGGSYIPTHDITNVKRAIQKLMIQNKNATESHLSTLSESSDLSTINLDSVQDLLQNGGGHDHLTVKPRRIRYNISNIQTGGGYDNYNGIGGDIDGMSLLSDSDIMQLQDAIQNRRQFGGCGCNQEKTMFAQQNGGANMVFSQQYSATSVTSANPVPMRGGGHKDDEDIDEDDDEDIDDEDEDETSTSSESNDKKKKKEKNSDDDDDDDSSSSSSSSSSEDKKKQSGGKKRKHKIQYITKNTESEYEQSDEIQIGGMQMYTDSASDNYMIKKAAKKSLYK